MLMETQLHTDACDSSADDRKGKGVNAKALPFSSIAASDAWVWINLTSVRKVLNHDGQHAAKKP
jgi:hypothetical protein